MSGMGKYIMSYYVKFNEDGAVNVWIPKWICKRPNEENAANVTKIIVDNLSEIPIEVRKEIYEENKKWLEYNLVTSSMGGYDHERSYCIFQIYTGGIGTLGGETNMRKETSDALLEYIDEKYGGKK